MNWAAIDWNAVVPAVMASGVLEQGWAAARWVARMEMRVSALEQKGIAA